MLSSLESSLLIALNLPLFILSRVALSPVPIITSSALILLKLPLLSLTSKFPSVFLDKATSSK